MNQYVHGKTNQYVRARFRVECHRALTNINPIDCFAAFSEDFPGQLESEVPAIRSVGLPICLILRTATYGITAALGRDTKDFTSL